ncbi:MAG: serine protease [Candidatus Pacebacteria bacterium]|nr:serine protease [Candidatus Paceibacterota bacterium]
MLKNIFKIIIIFTIGTIGGIFADQILWPYFIERPLFYKYRLEQSPVYVTEKYEVFIEENTLLEDIVEDVEKSVIGIGTAVSGKNISGSGIIVTSDGLVLTLAELVPASGAFAFYVDSKVLEYQILKRDLDKNLALIKINEENLKTVAFADFGSLRYGKRIFLVSSFFEKGLNKSVNEGIIKNYNDKIIQTNMTDKTNVKGSPVFNIKGELVGIANVDSLGKISAVPINIIREFIGL